MADPEHDGDLEDAQAVIALLKEHAEELRRKGVPVEAMIRALSRLHVLNLPGDPPVSRCFLLMRTEQLRRPFVSWMRVLPEHPSPGV